MPRNRLDRAGRVLAAGLLAGLLPAVAQADIVLSSNDGHTVVDDKGNLIAPPKPMPDTVSIIDVSQYPPTIKDTIEVPGSVGTVQRLGGLLRYFNDRREMETGSKTPPRAKPTPILDPPAGSDSGDHSDPAPIPPISGHSQRSGRRRYVRCGVA